MNPGNDPSLPLEQQVSDPRARIGDEVRTRLFATPGVIRLDDDRVDMFVLPDFVAPHDRHLLMEMIDRGAEPSPIFAAEGFENHRTSSSCNFDRGDALTQRFDARFDDLLGLPNRSGETIQAQRYAPGQHFGVHADFFFVDQPYWAQMEPLGGQRTWTAMVYLNEPEQGGATLFPNLGIQFEPQAGQLLAWNNMNRDGAPNALTMHQGCPVEAGMKYIITKWYREGNWY